MDATGDKPYDLEERTFLFAHGVRKFLRQLPRSVCNIEDGKQLARSSGSIGANFIEAMEALSRKDRLYRFRVSLKEAKEARYRLRLIDLGRKPDLEDSRKDLIDEARQLMNIPATIIRKTAG
jgi:four helix bundle protein